MKLKKILSDKIAMYTIANLRQQKKIKISMKIFENNKTIKKWIKGQRKNSRYTIAMCQTILLKLLIDKSKLFNNWRILSKQNLGIRTSWIINAKDWIVVE